MNAIRLTALLALIATPLYAPPPDGRMPQGDPNAGGTQFPSSTGPLLVYENGDSDILEECAHEITQKRNADDFVVVSDAYIDAAEIDWAICCGGAWDGTIEWAIYLDGGGVPGAVFASGTGQNIVTVSLGSSPNATWWNSSWDFGQQLVVLSGQTYWFGVHFSSDCATRDDVYWGCSQTQTGSPTAAQFMCAGVWAPTTTLPTGRDHAFSLSGDFLVATEHTTWGQIKSTYAGE